MKWTLLKPVALIFLGLLACTMGHAQNEVVISGYVYQKPKPKVDSIFPVANINVINLRSFTATSTDANGFFTTAARKGDTLIFSSVVHKRDTFIVGLNESRQKLFLSVVLEPQLYELDIVEVYGKDWEGFKHDFVNLEVKDTMIIRLAPQWKFEPVKEGFGITINGPLTALWNAFSKQGKELRKLAAIIAAEQEKTYLDSVYKRPIVLKFLELDENEMEELIHYCNFEKKYIEGATDYELLSALERCYESYRQERR